MKENTTTAIVIADGEGSRWQGHLGIDKHFIEIGGEKIIERTERLLHNKVDNLYIVKSNYTPKHGKVFGPKHEPENYDADKFLNSKLLWNPQGRTIVLYGDVYFTNDAIDQILKYKEPQWVLWCRPTPSELTGKQWGECFAQSFWFGDTLEHNAALRRVVNLYKTGIIRRCGGWEHYRAMLRLPDNLINEHLYGPRMKVIDDWTEDFDHPFDYDRFIERFNK